LDSLTEEEMRAMTTTQKFMALSRVGTGGAITFDKIQLLEGKATQNVGHVIQYLDDLKRRRHEGKG